MSGWHFSEKLGRKSKCSAQEENCPLVSEDGLKVPHFKTEQEAIVYEEAYNTEKYKNFNTFSKNNNNSDNYKEEVRNFIDNEEIMDRLEEIEFMDHSYAGKDWITLQELQNDPSLMSNNCLPAASEISEQFYDLGYFEVKFKDNKMHAANIYETEDGTKMVVDFTAAQYDNDDPELEMPYLQKKCYQQVWINI